MAATGGPHGGGSLGRAAAEAARGTVRFLDYMAGVLTLLSLTAAVVLGLAATDRTVLTPRQRVSMQSAHRAAAVASLGFLAIHIAVKVYQQEAGPLAAAVPFAGGSSPAVGLGVIAAYLMVLIALTGAVRGRFAGGRRPWLWRALHGTAYGCWPIALSHGLTAGRSAALWVLWGYGLCAAAVALALTVRTMGALGRRSARRRTRRALRAYAPGRSPEHAPAADEPLLLAVHGSLTGTADSTGTDAAHRTTGEQPRPQPHPQPQPLPHPQEQQPGYQPPYAPAPQYAHAQQYAQYVQYAQYAPAQEYAQAAPPAAGPWPGDTGARPHPALAETPPHGFAYPTEVLAAGYAQPYAQPGAVPGWSDSTADWGALTWDTPPHGVPSVAGFAPAAAGFPGEHGGVR